MADFLSPAERSERMSRIRGQHTKPELAVRRLLHAAGFRFRLHVADLAGRPDIVLPKYQTVIFVHGCFWHRHGGCPVASNPKSNREFWETKFDMNVRRDKRNQANLRRLGWHVFVVWECQVSSNAKSVNAANRLSKQLVQISRLSARGSSLAKKKRGY
jgi:DNA mismatch endonuclease, patch repair protein